jgi:hypothetical protein
MKYFHLYTQLATGLSFITLIDVVIRVRRSWLNLRQDIPILYKAIRFLNDIKTSIVDVVILLVRIRVFYDKKSLTEFPLYLISCLRVI